MCLESRPEVAAIKADCPVMVTSGATPLEGLPGDHISGEIDPAIVSLLEAEHDYGPEQINAMLTQHSGIRGLTGEKYGLRDVFLRSGEEEMKAREIFLHRLLLATGAGLAAMGGLDAVVFSGANAGLAVHLRPWLESRLNRIPRLNSTSICWLSLEQGLHSVLATLGSMLAFPLAVDSPGGCRA
jgi:acetate kinase